MIRLCAECTKRRAVYWLKIAGARHLQARDNHDLCLQCFRSKKEAENQRVKFGG